MQEIEKVLEGSPTICELITVLYVEACVNDHVGSMGVLERIYMQAKKMNRKLVLNKYGHLPEGDEHNSYREEDWENDLKVIRVRYGVDYE